MLPYRPAARPADRRRRYPLWRLVRANLYDFGLLLRETRFVLAAFAVVAAVSTIYLRYGYPAERLGTDRPETLAEALYETLTLLTLQSDLDFPTGDLLGQLIFFLTPLLGLALIFQSVLNFGRLLLDKGSRREEWQVSLASTYRDHVIVCGLGRLGMRVVDQLVAAGYEPVVVEIGWDTEFVRRMINFKVPVVVGDGREPATLRSAGIHRARALVTAINDDLLNIEIALVARAMRPDLRVILRIFNEELDRNLERTLGRNTAFSASALAAPTFAAAAVNREVDVVLPLYGVPLGVTQLRVTPESGLCGPRAAAEERAGVRVLAHRRARRRGEPPGGATIAGGDTLMAIGSLPQLDALRGLDDGGDHASAGGAGAEPPTVIVCGLGKVGYRVVRQLARMQPRPKIVVVRLGDGRAEFPQHISRLEGVTSVVGDARDLEVLRRAGLDHAYSVAALTSDDLLNLQIGLAARGHRPDVHIVLRTFSDALAERLSELVGIRTTYSTSALAAPTLAAAAVLGDVRSAFYAEGRLFASGRIALAPGHPLAGRTVGAVRDEHGVQVIGVRRDGAAQALPPSDTQLAAGDEVAVLAALDALGRLRAHGR